MIRSAVTVSLVPESRGGPFVFWDDLPAAIHKAKQLGYDAIEIFAPGPEAIDVADLQKRLADAGLLAAAFGTGAGWVRHRLHLTLPDAGLREKAKTFIRAMIDVAGPFGAPVIIGSMQGRYGDTVDKLTALRYLTDALDELGEHARQYDVPLIYEPLNRYETNLANTVEDGVSILNGLVTKNVKLLADLFHMNIEEVDVAAAIRAGGASIGHVHFVDSNRRPAGMGHLNFPPIAMALREILYDGYASAEAFAYPDPDAAAKQTIEEFRKWFRA